VLACITEASASKIFLRARKGLASPAGASAEHASTVTQKRVVVQNEHLNRVEACTYMHVVSFVEVGPKTQAASKDHQVWWDDSQIKRTQKGSTGPVGSYKKLFQ
jgi:hypothetical protein